MNLEPERGLNQISETNIGKNTRFFFFGGGPPPLTSSELKTSNTGDRKTETEREERGALSLFQLTGGGEGGSLNQTTTRTALVSSYICIPFTLSPLYTMPHECRIVKLCKVLGL